MGLTTEEIEKRVKDSYELPNNVINALPDPMVTVRTSTYQHASYIEDCIQGVLMQETTFSVEYIIGEDYSTDGTREIVFEYARQYPDKIRVITADYNVGAKANGRRCIRGARGKYTAICEGDDYWTDPKKLQTQVDFMEANPNFSLCFHNVYVKNEDYPEYSGVMITKPLNNVLTLDDILESNFVPSASKLFRADIYSNPPECFNNLPIGDWPQNIALAEHGPIGYIDSIYGVYRRHAKGAWTGLNFLDACKTNILVLEIIDKYLDYKKSNIIQKNISHWHFRIAEHLYIEGGDKEVINKHLKFSFRKKFFNEKITLKKRLALYLQNSFPKLYMILKQFYFKHSRTDI